MFSGETLLAFSSSGCGRLSRFLRSSGSLRRGRFLRSSGSLRRGRFLRSSGSLRRGRFLRSSGSLRRGRFLRSSGSLRRGRFLRSGGSLGHRGLLGSQCNIGSEGSKSRFCLGYATGLLFAKPFEFDFRRSTQDRLGLKPLVRVCQLLSRRSTCRLVSSRRRSRSCSTKALFMTVWRPSTRSAENRCGIRQG